MDISAHVRQLFVNRGDSQYGGEVVTQLEHALQYATLAEQSNATPALVIAALLHDVGHLLHDLPPDTPGKGVDDHHETSGFSFLREHFPAEVFEPVRMHVDAKRYLCAVDPRYRSQLSEPSVVSLELQGGSMSLDEVERFERSPHYQNAVELRKWDDLAKIEGMKTPNLDHFLSLVGQVAGGRGN